MQITSASFFFLSRFNGLSPFPRVSQSLKIIVDLVNDLVYYLNMEKHEWSDQIKELHHQGDEPHLIFEIMRTHRAIINVFSRAMGMPFSHVKLLRVLALAFPRETGILDIARRLHINGAAVTRQIREMELDGLIARRPDERDGRRQLVKLTAKGRKLFEQIHEMQHAFEKSFASGDLKPQELQTAAKVLFRLRSMLEKTD
jgi:DNA-binding MarR family transcriptional regulator